MMVSIVVFLVFMIGLFSLKQQAIIPLLIVPLLVICVIFWYFVTKAFSKKSATLTFTSAMKVRDLSPELILVIIS